MDAVCDALSRFPFITEIFIGPLFTKKSEVRLPNKVRLSIYKITEMNLRLIKETENILRPFESQLEAAFESQLSHLEKWQLICYTVLGVIICLVIEHIYLNLDDILDGLKSQCFQFLRTVPPIKKYITKQLDTSRQEIEKGMFEDAADCIDMPLLKALPSQGWDKEEVSKIANIVLRGGKYEWKSGKISGGAFSGTDDAYTDLLVEMFGQYNLSNPLHADIFPGARKMEAEIVQMTLQLFKGNEEHCGTLTMGGSESLLMACKAMRDYGKKNKGIKRGEIVMCMTAHSAVDKSAKILGMKIRKIRHDPNTFKVDLDAMKKAINSNTVMLVASAPSFPHGIIDDIEAIGQLGLRYNVPVHIDCCMGGFLLPFMEGAGYHLPPFDFRVPGVTSISADTHKITSCSKDTNCKADTQIVREPVRYGNAPKGSSVVMYSNPDYRHCQYFVTPEWPGGIYASPTIPGSRPGGLVAVCWAALLYHGVSGYTEAARKIIKTARTIKKLLNNIPEIRLMGDPLTSIVGFTSDKVNILKIGDLMNRYGWHLTYVQYPPGLHICLTSLQATDEFAKNFVGDLEKTVQEIKQTSDVDVTGVGKVYGTAATIPDKSLVGEAAKIFLTCYYDSGFKEDSKSTENTQQGLTNKTSKDISSENTQQVLTNESSKGI